MRKQDWIKVKSAGLTRYVLLRGVFLVGGAGELSLIYMYLANIDWNLRDFKLETLIAEYLVWTPVVVCYGIVIFTLNWSELNKKYKD